MAAAPGSCRTVFLAVSVFAVAAVFFVIGALGPPHTFAHHHPVRTCIVESSHRHVLDTTSPLVGKDECTKLGKPLDLEMDRHKDAYPLSNILFFVPIPFRPDQIMSRLFQFVVADLGVHFSMGSYTQLIMDHHMNTLVLEVALGYRDDVSGPWTRLSQGNISRTVQCRKGDWDYFLCEHIPLFELGSCHHKQYLVNFVFPSLPLSHMEEFKGLAPLSKLAVYVIHQTMHFTKMWFILKCVLFPISLVVMCWLLWRLAGKSSPASLIDKCLVFLTVSLTAYNAPIEMLTVYFNCPWMLVVNDFRQGLLIAGLFTFWIVFVGEHAVDADSTDATRTLGHYWKQLGVVAVSSVFIFVYEFCERGIQVFFPFYSLWSNWLSRYIAWLFLSVFCVSALVYVVMFLILVVRGYKLLQRREANLSQLSVRAREKAKGLFSHWKCFLSLTVAVAMVSIGTVVLPSEVLLHQWQHGNNMYSIYTALVIGNYGLWNAYTIITTLLHAPSRGTVADEDAPEAAQKLLTKHSAE